MRLRYQTKVRICIMMSSDFVKGLTGRVKPNTLDKVDDFHGLSLFHF